MGSFVCDEVWTRATGLERENPTKKGPRPGGGVKNSKQGLGKIRAPKPPLILEAVQETGSVTSRKTTVGAKACPPGKNEKSKTANLINARKKTKQQDKKRNTGDQGSATLRSGSSYPA